MILQIPKLIIIDLDGTLIDTVPDLAEAVDGMMTQLNLPKRGEAKTRRWVGNGIDRLVKRALLDQLEGEPEPKLFQSALASFKQLYAISNGRHSALYPGIQEGLDWLKSQDYKLVCITNKAEQFTLPLLKSLNIHHYFQKVYSGDTLAKKKPDPLPLLHAAQSFAIEPPQALMVGDSKNDVIAARAAGLPVLCVSYGYNHGEDIHLAKPDAVIDSLAELSSILNDE